MGFPDAEGRAPEAEKPLAVYESPKMKRCLTAAAGEKRVKPAARARDLVRGNMILSNLVELGRDGDAERTNYCREKQERERGAGEPKNSPRKSGETDCFKCGR